MVDGWMGEVELYVVKGWKGVGMKLGGCKGGRMENNGEVRGEVEGVGVDMVGNGKKGEGMG